jgi:hypothetical protein
MLRVPPKNVYVFGIVSVVRTILKTTCTLRSTLLKNGLVRDAQQIKQCVYNIPCYCGRYYIGKIRRPLEICTKEHKYNMAHGLLENEKLSQHAYREDEIPLERSEGPAS